MICTAIGSIVALTCAQAQFSVEFLGSFPPAVTQRMNAAGQIAGDFQYNSIPTAMRYDPAVGRVPMSVPAGTIQSLALGINDAGFCVGRFSPPTGSSQGALWAPDNSLTALPMPPGTWSYSTASGVNNAGTVCGAATLAVTGPDPQQAWRWTALVGYDMLPGIGGIDSLAWDINATGDVIGRGTTAAGLYRAILWQGDTAFSLPMPTGSTQAYGLAINDAGDAIGTTNSNNDAWVYRAATSSTVKLPDLGFKCVAYDINNSGWIAGWAESSPFEYTPVVWDPAGVLHNVGAAVSSSQFYFPGDFSAPICLSDANVIAVRGYDFPAGGDPRVVRFHVALTQPCPADLDSDGQVGASDLTVLLADWGSAGSDADFNGDGIVAADDLAALLGAWGLCGS